METSGGLGGRGEDWAAVWGVRRAGRAISLCRVVKRRGEGSWVVGLRIMSVPMVVVQLQV